MGKLLKLNGSRGRSLRIHRLTYIFSLKVLRVKDKNKNKIQNGTFIFLEELKSQCRVSGKSIYTQKSGLIMFYYNVMYLMMYLIVYIIIVCTINIV